MKQNDVVDEIEPGTTSFLTMKVKTAVKRIEEAAPVRRMYDNELHNWVKQYRLAKK